MREIVHWLFSTLSAETTENDLDAYLFFRVLLLKCTGIIPLWRPLRAIDLRALVTHHFLVRDRSSRLLPSGTKSLGRTTETQKRSTDFSVIW